ncbi:MAG TPA: rod shape-determining protein MreD [Longimicrobiales bacterium]|nr:rod shape-determining protein MreD [Longimicrobiales bacterium]
MAARDNRAFSTFVAVLVLLHLALHVGFGWGANTPDLIAVAVLLSARRLSSPRAALLGLVLGLLADALSLNAFGASAVALVAVAWLGSRSRDLFEGGSLGFIGLYVFIGKWLADAIYLLVAPAGGPAGRPWGSLLAEAPLRALITAVAGVLALAVYRALVGEHRGR